MVSDVLTAGMKKGQRIKLKDISITETKDPNGFTTLNLSSKITQDKKNRKKKKKKNK